MTTQNNDSQVDPHKRLEEKVISKDEKHECGKQIDVGILQYRKVRNKLTGINNPHPWSLIGLR